MTMAANIIDIYATKGIEYVFVIGFLLILVLFWKVFSGGRVAVQVMRSMAATGSALRDLVEWFRMPAGYYFHQGHTWARPENGNNGPILVGIDDFASKLAGKTDTIKTAKVGETISAGEPALTLNIDSRSIAMLAPVGGRVLVVNEEALRSPDCVSRDPYGKGWILKVEPAHSTGALKNLLAGDLAANWIQQETRRLRSMLGPEAAVAYQDGGLPVEGMARIADPEKWDGLMREFFLTDGGKEY